MSESYTIVNRGSAQENEARKQLFELFSSSPIPDDQALTNLGLFTRATGIAKLLYLHELYSHVLRVPGVVMEFGIWWGANLALLQGLRSVLEPYNVQRTVVGFDTFAGYSSIDSKDGDSSYVADGGYSVTNEYQGYLEQVLQAHEDDNVLSHHKKFELVKGDVTETVPRYLEQNPHTIVALAYLDVALYQPTKAVLEAIRPHLVKGSVVAMDELNSPDFPGETVALQEVFGLNNLQLVRSQYLPDRAYWIVS